MTKLTATTPFGQFSRDTHTMYTHVAVFTAPSGIRIVGARYMAAVRKGLPTTTEFGTVWSRSEANAKKAKMPYNSNATLVGVFPVDQDTDAMLAEAIQAQAPVQEESPVVTVEETPAPVETPAMAVKGELLTREMALTLVGTDAVVKQVGKSLTHQVKLDKSDPTLARTLCGVPVKGAAQNWLGLSDFPLTCPTCQATVAKLSKLAAKATKSAPAPVVEAPAPKGKVECQGSFQEDAITNRTGNKADCKYCGSTLQVVSYGKYLRRHKVAA